MDFLEVSSVVDKAFICLPQWSLFLNQTAAHCICILVIEQFEKFIPGAKKGGGEIIAKKNVCHFLTSSWIIHYLATINN